MIARRGASRAKPKAARKITGKPKRASSGSGRHRTLAGGAKKNGARQQVPSPQGRKPPAAKSERQGKRLPPAAAQRIFDTLAKALPDPKSELEYRSSFELLVAVILSAQATDKSVNLATAKLYPVANTPQAILALGDAGLLQYIRTIGLAPSKARNIIATCKLLLERHGGEVPRTREDLEALAGVGRKTANVVLNVAFGEHTLAVDTHVFRLGNRTGLAPGKTPLDVEQGLLKITPPEHLRHAHHYLILHGRYVCTARNPKCAECVIRQDCAWPDKTV